MINYEKKRGCEDVTQIVGFNRNKISEDFVYVRSDSKEGDSVNLLHLNYFNGGSGQ